MKSKLIATLLMVGMLSQACVVETVFASGLGHIQEAVGLFYKTHRLHGTVALGAGDEVFYATCAGEARWNSFCALETQYPIGSITKQFTAAALLRVLWDRHCEGSLEKLKRQLSRPLIDFLPDSDPLWQHTAWNHQAPAWASQVTLHHLLSNTSGIFDASISPAFFEFDRVAHTPAEVLAFFTAGRGSLAFEPGSCHEYSNSNFFLAGIVVERLSGQTLSDYLCSTFFEPLEMESTLLPSGGTVADFFYESSSPHLASGYVFSLKDESVRPVLHTMRAEHNQGDGGMLSTAGDLIKWNYAFYETEKVLPKAVRDLILAPTVLKEGGVHPYGYGIEAEPKHGGLIYSHSGLVLGFQSYLGYDPQARVTLVHLSNVARNMEHFMDAVTRQGEIATSMLSDDEKTRAFEDLAQIYPKAEGQMECYRCIEFKDL